MPAQRHPEAWTAPEPLSGRTAEALLSPPALLGWGSFASATAAVSVVLLHGTFAHALAVAALGLSATVLLGWLAGPPDAPAARALARARRVTASADTSRAPAAAQDQPDVELDLRIFDLAAADDDRQPEPQRPSGR